jgi:hypothetical protein
MEEEQQHGNKNNNNKQLKLELLTTQQAIKQVCAVGQNGHSNGADGNGRRREAARSSQN